MATKIDSTIVRESFVDFQNGITSALEPDQLPTGYSAWASNSIFRRGKPKTRPPFKKLGSLPTGKFQGAKYYSINSGSVMLSIDGRIYRFRLNADAIDIFETTISTDVATTATDYIQPSVGDSVAILMDSTDDLIDRGVVQVGGNQYYISRIISGTQIEAVNLGNNGASNPGVTIAAGSTVYYLDINNPRSWFCYFEQAGNHMIVQNGIQKAVIYDGSSSTRATSDQVPTGTRMAFGNGRLWVATNGEVRAGDIYGLTATSHLDFTEDTYLAEGGYFAMQDNVTAMGFLPRMDSTTSTGDLFVFTKGTTNTINATVYDRTQWKSTVGMQKILFPSIGAENQRSLSYANQDIVYESLDGTRSFRNTVIDQSDYSEIPITIDVGRIKEYDSELFKEFVSTIFFDNRLLITSELGFFKYESSDYSFQAGFNVAATKILVQDYATIAYAGKSINQAWDGEWTGLNVMQFVKGRFDGVDRLLAVCVESDGSTALYEILKDGIYDELDEDTDISCYVETKSIYFGLSNNPKRISGGSLYFSNIIGDLEWTIYYRPDEYCQWSQWATGSASGPSSTCAVGSECTISCDCNAYSYPARFGAPPDECNNDTGTTMNNGTKFQFKIAWTGKARLDQFNVDAVMLPNTAGGSSC